MRSSGPVGLGALEAGRVTGSLTDRPSSSRLRQQLQPCVEEWARWRRQRETQKDDADRAAAIRTLSVTRSFRDAPAALVKANEEREAERLARDLLLQEEAVIEASVRGRRLPQTPANASFASSPKTASPRCRGVPRLFLRGRKAVAQMSGDPKALSESVGRACGHHLPLT
ncbi:unnamed protein product [Symbiodinium natans]|uniref:Uncharacterized protein n=1 Tax=Symbiodinium natans TaxID=878477 RepID=A0A812TZP0_9DINO|nr:unnamed protein product [Symbiodinium natans]